MVDYSAWSIPQEKMYSTRLTDLDDLKHCIRIRTEWAKLYHAIIAAAVRQWRRRLSVRVRVSSTAFNCGIVSFAITVAFEAFVDSRIQQLISPSDFLAVVRYDVVCVLMHDGRLIHKVK